ncbi:hypothetical protein IWX49DRAFT_549880 [Phyllosticta citricarpa]
MLVIAIALLLLLLLLLADAPQSSLAGVEETESHWHRRQIGSQTEAESNSRRPWRGKAKKALEVYLNPHSQPATRPNPMRKGSKEAWPGILARAPALAVPSSHGAWRLCGWCS